MNELALFAGIGGGLLGSKLLGWRTVCYVEKNPYCVDIIKARIADGYLDDAPIWDDARTFDGKPWAGSVDIVTAGFPCQPFSFAGKRNGESDERNLWPDTIRIIREVRPRYALLENVPNVLANEYMGEIFGSLVESGYDCRWDCISAAAVGAPHRRDRLWIVAQIRAGREMGNTNSENPQRHWQRCENGRREVSPGQTASTTCWEHDPADGKTKPRLDRLADGIPYRVVRQRAIGNAQVPAVVRIAWNMLSK